MDLGLPHVDRKTILVMGGGEGVGSLSNIVNKLFVELVTNGIDAVVLVVCGRNEKLKKALGERDWEDILRRHHLIEENRLLDTSTICGSEIFPSFTTTAHGCMKEGTVTKHLRKILSSGSMSLESPVSIPIAPYNPDDPKAFEIKKNADEVSLEVTYNKTGQATVEDELREEEAAPSTAKEAVNDTAVASTVSEGSTKNAAVEEKPRGHVSVVGLGFVTRMAEYMVAADMLVSKAGPGTISEAAALSLPVLLTSFLPGQEEGNVDYVIDGGFGAFVSDSDAQGVAETVASWLTDNEKISTLSQAAKAKGAPHAARDIAKAIGDSTIKWREINERHTEASGTKS